jgi:hypothetical protein
MKHERGTAHGDCLGSGSFACEGDQLAGDSEDEEA